MINDKKVIDKIIRLNPDLIICYGASIIKSDLINKFSGKFINIHLGLSPYYRGSGTNVWPLINCEPEYVGATFMHIDKGIDTGSIIHQIRAEIALGDSPHSIGCRLIAKTCEVCKTIVKKFDNLYSIEYKESNDGKFYLRKDFDVLACEKLYSEMFHNTIRNYINNQESRQNNAPIIKNSAVV
jgi:methionyl-tRNA formyltransferase